MESRIAPLVADIQKAAAQILQLNTQISESENKLTSQVSQLETQLQETKKMAIISATLVDPWRAEDWVHEILMDEPSSQAAFRIVRSYLKIVDELLPDPDNLGSYVGRMEQITKKRGYYSDYGPSADPLYYWRKALEWQKIVDNQPNQPYSRVSSEAIDRQRSKVEAYQKRQGTQNSNP